MRISDWSSDVCSSDLCGQGVTRRLLLFLLRGVDDGRGQTKWPITEHSQQSRRQMALVDLQHGDLRIAIGCFARPGFGKRLIAGPLRMDRSEEHTSELQSLMRISYAVFCLKKKKKR